MTPADRLISMGAQCVTGDLIRNRVVVGQYRNGQLILTKEGADLLDNVVDVEPKAPAVAAPNPVKVKATKAKAPAAEPAAQETPVDETADLLAGLDEALSA